MADPLVPPRRGEFLTPSGVATKRFSEYLERLTATTNETSEENIILVQSDQANLNNNLAGFRKKLSSVVVNSDYDCIGNEIIICMNTTPITITLKEPANNLDQVHVKRQNIGAVTIVGNVDGGTTFKMPLRYDSAHLMYTTGAGEYSIL